MGNYQIIYDFTSILFLKTFTQKITILKKVEGKVSSGGGLGHFLNSDK